MRMTFITSCVCTGGLRSTATCSVTAEPATVSAVRPTRASLLSQLTCLGWTSTYSHSGCCCGPCLGSCCCCCDCPCALSRGCSCALSCGCPLLCCLCLACFSADVFPVLGSFLVLLGCMYACLLSFSFFDGFVTAAGCPCWCCASELVDV